MDAIQTSRVLGIALRTEKTGPMREVSEVSAIAGGGLTGDRPARPDRGITLISAAQWSHTMRQLGAALPWHTRRANILVDAPTLAGWIGRTVQVGELLIDIKGETCPCSLMDEFLPGLMSALTPECRAGVHGRILRGGTLRVGDLFAPGAPA